MIYEHNDKGDLIRAIDDSGTVWEWDYDDRGNLIHHIGPCNEFFKEYDTQKREVKYVCGNTVVVTEYEDDGSFTQTSIETKK